jgi:cysteine synthase A
MLTVLVKKEVGAKSKGEAMRYETILETLGATPLIRVGRLNETSANVWAKVEAFNPGGSAKDRVAAALVEAAEAAGVLQPGATIIEPTSGNTGIGLALVAAVKGYRLILTTPDSMSVERAKLCRAFGAEVVLTPGALGMRGAVEKAEALKVEIPGAWIPEQFGNPANPDAHFRTTAEEIWADLDGAVDAFVACVGTGGTLSGTAKFLKEQKAGIKAIAVEPAASAVISGGKAGMHKIQGIGAGFIPKVLDTSLIDEVIAVADDDAAAAARAAAAKEGLLVGISSGAALWAAIELSKREDFTGKTIVVLLPDTGERYLSTWLFE